MEVIHKQQLNVSLRCQKRRKLTIAWTIGNIFIGLVLILLLFIVLTMLFPNSRINFFGLRIFLVSDTRSMEPDFQHNDLIVIRRTEFSELQIGDIVTFKSAIVFGGQVREVFITHKIIERVYDGATDEILFITSGTHENIRPDVRLMSEKGCYFTNAYVGRLVAHSSFLGGMVAYLRSPFGIVMLLLNMGVLLAIIYLLPIHTKKSDIKKYCLKSKI